jgi:hypothetical protein
MSTIPSPFQGFCYFGMILPGVPLVLHSGLYLRRTCGASNRLLYSGIKPARPAFILMELSCAAPPGER